MCDIRDRCVKKGVRLTPQRLAVFNFLEGNRSHPAAEEIFTAVKKICPSISLATVYNTIERLQKVGELQTLTIDRKRRHFDPDTSQHHHIICETCGRIEDIMEDYSNALELPEEIKKVFLVRDNRVDFFGTCDKCGFSARDHNRDGK